MSYRWQYYPRYDVGVNIDDGEIKLPICNCGDEDMCLFKQNWISDGSPTHISGEELEKVKKWYEQDKLKSNTEI